MIDQMRSLVVELRAARRLHELREVVARVAPSLDALVPWLEKVERDAKAAARAEVQPLRESFYELELAMKDAQRQRDLAERHATEVVAESTAYRTCVDVAVKACDGLGMVMRPGDPVVAALFMLAAEVARLRPVYESARKWREKPFADGRASGLAMTVVAAEQEAP